eukprot:Gb_15352 [translate_table: standard]
MAQPLWIHQKKRMLLFQQSMPHRPATQDTFNTMANTIALQLEQLHASANDTSPDIYIDEDWRTLCKQSQLKGVLNTRLFMNNRRILFDDSAYASLLQGCHNNKSLPEAKLVNAHMIRTGFKPEIIIEANLLTTYAKCGSLMNARRVFDEMSERNVVSWTAMITAYSRYGLDEDALFLFYQMQLTGIRPNHFSFASVLPACANLAALKLGKEFHEQIIRSGFQSNVFVGSALVDMYVKCDNVEEALKVFDKMTERNVVSWNTMITGYAQNGQVVEALELFENVPERNVISWTSMIGAYARHDHDEKALTLFFRMQRTGIQPDKMIFASVLPACADLASLEHGKVVHEVIIRTLEDGKEVHEDITRSIFLLDIVVENALVDMYAKCGCIENARKVFDKMPRRNVVSWSTMIARYVMHGYHKEAIQLFEQMQYFGTEPNHVTFIGVSFACCHAEPDAVVWLSLLGVCRIHTNVELGELVAEQLFALDPTNAAHYVLLSNIYAVAGRWDDVENVQKMTKDTKVKKILGYSWIEVNNKVCFPHRKQITPTNTKLMKCWRACFGS